MIYPDMGYVPFTVYMKYKIFIDKNRNIKYNGLYKKLQRTQFSKHFHNLEFETLETDPKVYFRMFSLFRLHNISVTKPNWKLFKDVEQELHNIENIFEWDFRTILNKGRFNKVVLSKDAIMKMYYDNNISLCTVIILHDLFKTKYFKHIHLCKLGYQPYIESFNWQQRAKLIVEAHS